MAGKRIAHIIRNFGILVYKSGVGQRLTDKILVVKGHAKVAGQTQNMTGHHRPQYSTLIRPHSRRLEKIKYLKNCNNSWNILLTFYACVKYLVEDLVFGQLMKHTAEKLSADAGA